MNILSILFCFWTAFPCKFPAVVPFFSSLRKEKAWCSWMWRSRPSVFIPHDAFWVSVRRRCAVSLLHSAGGGRTSRHSGHSSIPAAIQKKVHGYSEVLLQTIHVPLCFFGAKQNDANVRMYTVMPMCIAYVFRILKCISLYMCVFLVYQEMF